MSRSVSTPGHTQALLASQCPPHTRGSIVCCASRCEHATRISDLLYSAYIDRQVAGWWVEKVLRQHAQGKSRCCTCTGAALTCRVDALVFPATNAICHSKSAATHIRDEMRVLTPV